MEFTYNESRTCKRGIIFTRTIFLLLHLFSIYYDYDNIKKDKYFTYYLFTILSIFLSLCNNIRYEYAHYKILGYTFTSLEEFTQWKEKHQFKNISYVLIVFELSMHIYFVINTITTFSIDKRQILYSVSYLIIYTYTMITTVIMICIFIVCCSLNLYMSICSSFWNYNSNSNPNPNPNLNGERDAVLNNVHSINTLNIVIYIDDKKECCICLDKNNNEWIRTQCNHEFHKTCINSWYETTNTCPVCRHNL